MLLFLFLSYVCGSLAASFNYNRCDSTYGPSGWGGSCQSGTQNTPINLCGAIAFPTTYTTGFTLNSNWNMARTVQIYNPGYTIQIKVVDNAPTTQVGALAALVGRGSNTSTQTWVLEQMHVHFGRTGKLNEGSEHYMQGKAYPMEIHFVHYNSAIGTSVTTAAATGKAEALLVVGIFIEVGAENSVLSAMANAAETATSTYTTLGKTVNFNDLFDGSGYYYSYGGGLTTPGCNEIVTWVVMKASKTISEGSLQKFKKATTTPSAVMASKFDVQATGAGTIQGDYGTFRPLQATNGRTIYSSNGATDACTTVTEPTFSCSAGMLTYPSLLVSLLAIGFWVSQL